MNRVCLRWRLKETAVDNALDQTSDALSVCVCVCVCVLELA